MGQDADAASTGVTAAGGFTRREALRRGAIFGGTALWVTPLVQTIGMSEALAQTGSPTPLECGRMTGGGSVLTDAYGRVTHGFTLYCGSSSEPNRLEVNWRVGNAAYAFSLDALTSRACWDDPAISAAPPDADFDTYQGAGTGRLRSGRGPFVTGYNITFTFTDAGEPGAQDWVEMTITGPGGEVVLSFEGFIEYGNQQAHVATGTKGC